MGRTPEPLKLDIRSAFALATALEQTTTAIANARSSLTPKVLSPVTVSNAGAGRTLLGQIGGQGLRHRQPRTRKLQRLRGALRLPHSFVCTSGGYFGGRIREVVPKRSNSSRFLSSCAMMIALSLIFAATVPLRAQSAGEITGTTFDSSHALVANVTIHLVNTQTGATLVTLSNVDGLYRFPSVSPGSYEIHTSSAGFAQVAVTGIVVEVSRTTHIDVVLTPQSVQQNVVVTAGLQSLDTDNGYKGQIITSRQVENLPLQTRSPVSLMLLTPGVETAQGGNASDRQASWGPTVVNAYVINGGVRTANGGFDEYLVDGISMTNLIDGSIMALPSLGAIQEFQVQSGGLPARLGNTVGGVISYVTKRGTNDFHGLLFEDYRGTQTNATPALPVGSARPNNNFNQFGGNLGGPVIIPRLYSGRNHTFFFADYDGSRYVIKTPETLTVPTALMHQGIFTETTVPIYDPTSSTNPALRTPFPNQTIPQKDFNPIGQKIMSLFPLPNRPGIANNYAGTDSLYDPVDIITARIDQVFGDRQTLGFKVTNVRSQGISTYALGSNDQKDQDVHYPMYSYGLFYNFSITPTLLYSAALGYTHYRRDFLDTSGNVIGGSYFGYTVNPTLQPGSPANVRPLATFDIYRGVGTGAPTQHLSLDYQLNQSFDWTHGRHSFTFGADLRRYYVSGLVAGGDPNGSFSFSSLQTSAGTSASGNSAASLLLGLPNTEIFQQEPDISLINFVDAFYASDDFRMTPNLTLNLGMRYEFVTPVTSPGNRVGWFNPTAINPAVGMAGLFEYANTGGSPRSITTGDFNNLAPRVGFAYAPRFYKGRTVIRGAFGTVYGPIATTGYYTPAPGFDSTLNPIKATATASPGALASSYALPPVTGPQGPSAALGLAISQTENRFASSPAVYQWNFGLQQALPQNWVFEILYSGSRGTHLLDTEEVDLPSYSLLQQAISLESSTGNKGAAQAFLNQTVPNPLAGKVPGSLGAAKITRANASKGFPQFAGVTVLRGDRDSIYHSLQATLQRRLGSNLNVLLAYTFSKLIDDTDEQKGNTISTLGVWQNPYDLRDARAVSSYDSTHIFTGSVVYALPFGRGQRFLSSGFWERVAGRFQLTGIVNLLSGTPLGIMQSAANGLGLGAQRPDKIGNPQDGRHTNANGSIQWINAAAFAPVDGRFGTAPIRDSRLRGPAYADVDLGLQRNFRLWEHLNMEFRAEAFNAPNHTNLGLPTQDISSPAFGQIDSVATLSPRVVQVDLQLRF